MLYHIMLSETEIAVIKDGLFELYLQGIVNQDAHSLIRNALTDGVDEQQYRYTRKSRKLRELDVQLHGEENNEENGKPPWE